MGRYIRYRLLLIFRMVEDGVDIIDIIDIIKDI